MDTQLGIEIFPLSRDLCYSYYIEVPIYRGFGGFTKDRVVVTPHLCSPGPRFEHEKEKKKEVSLSYPLLFKAYEYFSSWFVVLCCVYRRL